MKSIFGVFGKNKETADLGSFSKFIQVKDNEITLQRDIIGLQPLFFHKAKDGLYVADEKKKLIKKGIKEQDIQELDPRKTLTYNKETHEIKEINRKFFDILPEHEDNIEQIKQQTKTLIENAIKKIIPQDQFGILFSGGIDSTAIAFIAKKLGFNPVCYTAVIEDENITTAEDLIYAEKVAKALDLKLKIKKIKLSEVESYIKKIIPIIESTNVVKVGVALPLFIACEIAKQDNIKTIFSGLGSEEIFAGYERHEQNPNINEECKAGLLNMYERDLYRDYTLTKFNNLKLEAPFLDEELVAYALKIPAKYKLKNEMKKWILRAIMKDMGLQEEFAMRKKRAAQYGSKFDKAITKLAKQKNHPTKSDYLNSLGKKLRLGALYSSGKDSTYALYLMKQKHDVKCLITLKSKNKDSYMFHTPNIDMVDLQAKAIGLPLLTQETLGEKEKELVDLENAIKTAKEQYQLDGIITGALFSKYQSERIEKIASKLGLQVFSPLWHKDQEQEMREIINAGFHIILSSVAADGLDKTWINKKITTEDIDKLVALNKKIGLNIAGEGGEFESLVLDGPLFSQKLEIVESEILEENTYTAKLLIKKAILKAKE